MTVRLPPKEHGEESEVRVPVITLRMHADGSLGVDYQLPRDRTRGCEHDHVH